MSKAIITEVPEGWLVKINGSKILFTDRREVLKYLDNNATHSEWENVPFTHSLHNFPIIVNKLVDALKGLYSLHNCNGRFAPSHFKTPLFAAFDVLYELGERGIDVPDDRPQVNNPAFRKSMHNPKNIKINCTAENVSDQLKQGLRSLRYAAGQRKIGDLEEQAFILRTNNRWVVVLTESKTLKSFKRYTKAKEWALLNAASITHTTQVSKIMNQVKASEKEKYPC